MKQKKRPTKWMKHPSTVTVSGANENANTAHDNNPIQRIQREYCRYSLARLKAEAFANP